MLSYDAQLLLLGAAIALFSSLITISVKDWVSARRRKIEREEEKKERQDEQTKATMRYLQAAGMLVNPDPETGSFTLSKREEDKPPE